MSYIKTLEVNHLSEQLLLQVKKQETTDQLRKEIEHLDLQVLTSALRFDVQKKAFWINIYNAFFQILRREQKIGKPEIFRAKLIPIAGHYFSLDDIEHGILRKYRHKWSLGYLANPFASSLIKQLAVSKVDYRIHFALNCGAKSCPPIAFYTEDKLDQQLDLATLSFLEGETEVFANKKEVHVTRLFQWFAGDFGGRKGVRKILQETLGLDISDQKLVYKAYDWEEDLNNFR